jgi:hypothetical protein
VIGADSVQTSTAGVQPVMQVTGGIKLELPWGRLIVACTGAVGLAQRFYNVLSDECQGKELDKHLNGVPIEFVTRLAKKVISNFEGTRSPLQSHPNHGWGFGCLMGFASDKIGPQLVEFDHMQFHPELKGETDDAGALKSRPFATMGSGQLLADPFIAHAHRVLFGEKTTPTVAQGRLLVTWTLQHASAYAVGHVGGELSIAQLQKSEKQWTTSLINVEEAQQQVQEIEAYIGGFGKPPPPPEPAPDLGQLATPST